ncbi:type I polyketide synthase [Gilliamella sp. App4-10]|uniref:type I polyketide synthase n=1 Tax=Gilliamella sp. App4-10 TaxID=3120231 RepID=UPI00080E4492|nr:type I polyketide synthase [Gilliamella apicola]OCG21776.1 polyketide synthase [Gilliamella apicola]
MVYKSKMTGMEVAIIGMAVRFPQSATLQEFWSNIIQAKECVTFFSPEELRAEGIDQATLNNPSYIRAKPFIENVCDFDAAFFGYSHKDAAAFDPKTRVLHEVVYHALEDAGYAKQTDTLIVGTFLGVSEDIEWLRRSITKIDGDALTRFSSGIYGHKDLSAFFIAHSMNFTGPVYSVYSSCSTSLSATHMACRSLLFGECDLALAGGITIDLPQKSGYFCQQGMIHSTDGHCRPFDSNATGTLFGDGAGVVVLRRLEDAIANGDRIYAVIRASAVNNDGNQKMGFAAPSQTGQKKVIQEAHRLAEIEPETIGYLETHGTGTHIGDPIEFSALTEAFATTQQQYCALGAVKANIGHTYAAAGVAGLIKAALVLHNRTIPPLANYQTPNPKIDLVQSPFYIPTQPLAWPTSTTPPRAGVSSFGIGGTNVHVILEAVSPVTDDVDIMQSSIIPFSAPSFSQLDQIEQQLTKLVNDTNRNVVAYTQQIARPEFACRRVLKVDSNGCQTVLTKLNNFIPISALGINCDDLRDHVDGSQAHLFRQSSGYLQEVSHLLNTLRKSAVLQKYQHETDLWSQARAGSLLARGCLAIVALKCWQKLLPSLKVFSGEGLGLLPAAVVIGIITLEDMLQMLLALDQNSAQLNIPNIQAPIADYTLALQKQSLSIEQYQDIGFWSEVLLNHTLATQQLPDRVNWLNLTSDDQTDFSALTIVAQLWCEGISVNWQMWYGDHILSRGDASHYPFHRSHYPLPNIKEIYDPVSSVTEQQATVHHSYQPPYQPRPKLGNPYISPQTAAMKFITDMMSDTLEIEPIGIDDDFFELGGHSLLVTQLTSRLEREFGVSIDLVALMETPNPRNIYAHLAQQLGGEENLELACHNKGVK